MDLWQTSTTHACIHVLLLYWGLVDILNRIYIVSESIKVIQDGSKGKKGKKGKVWVRRAALLNVYNKYKGNDKFWNVVKKIKELGVIPLSNDTLSDIRGPQF